MERRLYLTFPTPAHAREAVAELIGSGIPRADIHSVAHNASALDGLPLATPAQQGDRVWTIERLYWNLNLAAFFAALLCLLVALYIGSLTLVGGAAVVMLVTFVTGERFALRIPHSHLAEQQVPLEHGEVVVMVDVPANQVHDVEQLISRHHPEAGLGGVGWHIRGLHA